MLALKIPRSAFVKLPKLASCFVLSAALHGSVLLYHRHPNERIQQPLIPVALLEPDPLGDVNGGEGTPQSGHGAMPSRKNAAVKLARSGALGAGMREHRPSPDAWPLSRHEISEPAPVSPTGEGKIALAEDSAADSARVNFSFDAGSRQTAEGLAAGNGEADARASFAGNGSAFGTGSGHGAASLAGAPFVQAQYRDAPKPDYPERARREGRQGRVLLRVLVDREGKSQMVEVSGSSGSELLDRAAAETIKRWRFLPARYGDKPVESWVRIPVDFRLTQNQ